MTTKANSLLLDVAYEWETFYSSAAFSGIVGDEAHAAKGGYHISIEDQSSTNYSVVRPDDKAPPGDWSRQYATALDMSMNKNDMVTSTRRWMVVWSDRSDPRRNYFNGFNGWVGSGNAQRWDFVTNTVETSSNDHQWHQHTEIRRRYWNDPVAHQAMISVARGDTKEQWMATNGGIYVMFCKYGDKGENVKAMQFQLLQLDGACLPQFGPDGGYGDETAAALSRLVTGGDAKLYQGEQWALMQKMCQAKNGGGGGGGGLVQHTHTVESQSVFVAGSVTGAAVASSK